MKAKEIRKKYIEFFKKSPRNHKEISPAPLVLTEDPTTLFTSSGMQPLVPYLMGEPHPEGKRLVNSQPCFRAVDINEVGNNRHTTFFEMLGNWSLGDYFKKEQLSWIWEFLTNELGLPKERLWVTVSEGGRGVPKDEEFVETWKKLGVPERRIRYYGVDENWWSRSGPPDKMPPGEIGGPDSEVVFEFKEVEHDPKFGEECHPYCNCGRFLEIGNSVFIQYIKEKDGSLKELAQKNVDFGGGLERITAAVINSPDIFRIDLFEQMIKDIESKFDISYGKSDETDRSIRIIADHMRASSMLISSDVLPSNKAQGYVLRRLIRRSLFHASLLAKGEISGSMLPVIREQKEYNYPLTIKSGHEITSVVDEEAERFAKSLNRGLKKLKHALKDKVRIDGKFAFDLYQTDGIPIDLTVEILSQEGKGLSKRQIQAFEKEFEKHRQLSRTASTGMFKGGLADHSEEVKKLHTATHLLHAALRKVLGKRVEQKGSNITAERLRFDFSHPQKLSDSEIVKIEKLINEQIKKDLPVTYKTKTLKEAFDEGALAFFGEKYGERVRVYTIGDPSGASGPPFSREVCGGPHVKRTSEIGRVRIKKQEKIAAGVMRVYAVVKSDGN